MRPQVHHLGTSRKGKNHDPDRRHQRNRRCRPENAIAYKYADPTEDARWVYAEDDLRAIEREDPNLVVRVEEEDR